MLALIGAAVACQSRGVSSRPVELRAVGEVGGAASGATPLAAPSARTAPASSAPTLSAATRESVPWPPPAPTGFETDFCVEAMQALDEETCYVLPDTRTQELLLYLHGTIPPGKSSPQKTNLQTVLANAARRGQVAALLPRGRRGLAPATQQGWWGWPTSAAQRKRWSSELVTALNAKREKLEALSGARFTRLYLAGSSSGAYFAAALALNGELPADAFAAISGGAWLAPNQLATLTPKPFYVGYGRHDASVAVSAKALGERLREAGWPVKVAVHPLPHGAREVYLDEALAFFREQLPALDAP
jgi:predicted esterase